MLVSMKIKNFISYKDEAIFSMEKYSYRRKKPNNYMTIYPNNLKKNKLQLLKSVIVSGGNASGKTNLLLAMKAFKTLVMKGTNDINEEIEYHPFEFSDDRDNATTFIIEFIQDNQLYEYHISYINTKIIFEKLSIWKSENYNVLLERHNNNFSVFPKEYDEYIEEIRYNDLAIRLLQNKNWYHGVNVFKWFSRIVFLNEEIGEKAIYEHLKDESKKELIIKLLQSADFNIDDIRISKNKFDIDRLMNDDRYQVLPDNAKEKLLEMLSETHMDTYVEILHAGSTSGISLNMESTGTRVFLDLLLNLLFNEENKIFLMDEFDNSLFIDLALLIIDIISNNNNNSQCIFTTHNLDILNYENLSRDQIYLVDKNFSGNSSIYSVADFDDLSGGKIKESYLRGKLGAIPNIDSDYILKLIQRYNDKNDLEDCGE